MALRPEAEIGRQTTRLSSRVLFSQEGDMFSSGFKPRAEKVINGRETSINLLSKQVEKNEPRTKRVREIAFVPLIPTMMKDLRLCFCDKLTGNGCNHQ